MRSLYIHELVTYSDFPNSDPIAWELSAEGLSILDVAVLGL